MGSNQEIVERVDVLDRLEVPGDVGKQSRDSRKEVGYIRAWGGALKRSNQEIVESYEGERLEAFRCHFGRKQSRDSRKRANTLIQLNVLRRVNGSNQEIVESASIIASTCSSLSPSEAIKR